MNRNILTVNSGTVGDKFLHQNKDQNYLWNSVCNSHTEAFYENNILFSEYNSVFIIFEVSKTECFVFVERFYNKY